MGLGEQQRWVTVIWMKGMKQMKHKSRQNSEVSGDQKAFKMIRITSSCRFRGGA